MRLLSSRRRWYTWEPSFLLACGMTRKSTSWCRKKERRRGNRVAVWGTTVPAVCRHYRRSVRSANNNLLYTSDVSYKCHFFICWRAAGRSYTVNRLVCPCTVEHPCCVGEVASTSQCSFSPGVVTPARCSLPPGPQVSQRELSNFYYPRKKNNFWTFFFSP